MRSEKEKMLSGEYYNPYTEPLISERARARKLAHELNGTGPDEADRRRGIVSELLRIGENGIVEPPFHCDYGYNIEIGKNFFANFGCVMLDCNRIVIGDNVLLGPNVQIYTPVHPLHAEERQATRGVQRSVSVTIGDNVWIGGGTILCPGVTIGANTTIGAGSVVTRDIPDSVFAAGNPCRVIKRLNNG